MNSLITLLTIAPLLVHSLKCYEGHAGAVLKVEQKSLEKKTYMCLFEPKNPCTFDKPDEYNTYKYNPQYADKCITSDRAICFCTKDLCNGDYKVLMVSNLAGGSCGRWSEMKDKLR
ncbi:hypothetical protein Y032_0211g2202 [Ancylostoma ceylanicum]|uniref:Uncharacterized protein n=1 Tax=Ancylostoma ceylanicum TaxID=53326 RepID=A0A016SL33_9BILA|nr:hypothetical protein Y032_0211g2202 [Ancylostoma ceylanicum]